MYAGEDMNKAKMKILSGSERKYLCCGGLIHFPLGLKFLKINLEK